MSEKIKMLSGRAYKAFDSELICERQEAKERVFEFNSLRPAEMDRRNSIIEESY